MKARKSKGQETGSTPTINYEELEAFRNTLPPYRRQETYRLFAVSWDITRALYLIHKYPREIQTVDVAMFANSYGFPFIEGGASHDKALPEDSGFFYVDTKTVLADQVDLERPLLIALIATDGRERPRAALIDGLHRLFKAAWKGIAERPAYVLTPDEERLCRI
jgi:hypothetical protein